MVFSQQDVDVLTQMARQVPDDGPLFRVALWAHQPPVVATVSGGDLYVLEHFGSQRQWMRLVRGVRAYDEPPQPLPVHTAVAPQPSPPGQLAPWPRHPVAMAAPPAVPRAASLSSAAARQNRASSAEPMMTTWRAFLPNATKAPAKPSCSGQQLVDAATGRKPTAATQQKVTYNQYYKMRLVDPDTGKAPDQASLGKTLISYRDWYKLARRGRRIGGREDRRRRLGHNA